MISLSNLSQFTAYQFILEFRVQTIATTTSMVMIISPRTTTDTDAKMVTSARETKSLKQLL